MKVAPLPNDILSSLDYAQGFVDGFSNYRPYEPSNPFYMQGHKDGVMRFIGDLYK